MAVEGGRLIKEELGSIRFNKEEGLDGRVLSEIWTVRTLPIGYTRNGPIYSPYEYDDDVIYAVNRFDGKIAYFRREAVRLLDQHCTPQNPALGDDGILNDSELLQPFYDLEMIAPRGSRVEIKPAREDGLLVWLKLNDICQLGCTGCIDGQDVIPLLQFRKQEVPRVMSPEILQDVAKKICISAHKNMLRKIHVRLSGGEPTLSLEMCLQAIKEFSRHAQENFLTPTFSLVTNGVYFGEEDSGSSISKEDFVSKLKELGVHVIVSMDGDEDGHNSSRIYKGGKGSFEEVWRGLEFVAKSGIDHNINAVLNSRNVGEIDRLAEKVFDRFGFVPIHLSISRDTRLHYSHRPSDAALVNGVRRFFRTLYDECLNHDMVFPWSDMFDYFTPDKGGFRICAAGKNYVTVNTAGQFDSCHMLVNRGSVSRNNPDIVSASMDAHPIAAPYQDVRNLSHCSGCELQNNCKGGGCRLHEIVVRGRTAVSEKPLYCDAYKPLGYDMLDLRAMTLAHINGIRRVSC